MSEIILLLRNDFPLVSQAALSAVVAIGVLTALYLRVVVVFLQVLVVLLLNGALCVFVLAHNE